MAVLQLIALTIAVVVLALVAAQLIAVTLAVTIGLVGGLVRFLGMLLMLPFRLVAGATSLVSVGGPEEPLELGSSCPDKHCVCTNPASARFCRRCGRSLPSPLA
ncbi:MAG: hypothetical protein AAGI46_04745 [Planctomycetota bacterium]